MTAHVDPRLREVPPELLELVRNAIQQLGARRAARAFNIAPTTALAIAAGQKVMPGTLAILREQQVIGELDGVLTKELLTALREFNPDAPATVGRLRRILDHHPLLRERVTTPESDK